MSAPKFLIKANQKQKDSDFGLHQTSPGWCVAFVRFKEPACGYSELKNLLDYKEILVVEDDAVSVSISNSKNSYMKSCNITLKSGDVYYPNAVSPGDWVVVWMHEDLTKINEIVRMLKSMRSEKTKKYSQLNDWNSGLKFIGRVTSVGAVDQVSGRGIRTLTQTLSASSFLELSSSLYFTFIFNAFYNALDGASAGNKIDAGNKFAAIAINNTPRFKDFPEMLQSFFQGNVVSEDKADKNGGASGNKIVDPGKTPDQVILFLIIFLMGINEDDIALGSFDSPIRGSFNDAIVVPDFISKVCNTGIKGEIKLWQMYNVISGVQKYENKSNSPWANFSPKFKKSLTPKDSVKTIFETGTRLKGFVSFTPPNLSNITFWQAFNQYLNPLLNEMYTCLRIDAFNRIKPSVIIREQPFGTGLYNHLLKKDNKLEKLKLKQKERRKNIANKEDQTSVKQPVVESPENSPSQKGNEEFIKKLPEYLTTRAMYGNLPRWVIDESILLGISSSLDESNRVNLVQVWSETVNSYFNIYSGNEDAAKQQNAMESAKIAQLQLGNYVIDNNDISRNGLRAAVFNTDFDLKAGAFGEGAFTLGPIWAKMKADHLFNGHLKPSAVVECAGISAPIVEGDNLQVRGIVFHIESVRHNASISPNGIKNFRTSITLSNGIMAFSLEKDNDIPVFPTHTDNSSIDSQNTSGITDFEIPRDTK